MDNYNAKTERVLDTQKQRFDQSFVLIKDFLLYIAGNESARRNDAGVDQSSSTTNDPQSSDNSLIYPEGLIENDMDLQELDELLFKRKPPGWKKSFLVFKSQKYTPVPTDNIAFFYIRNNSASLMCFDKQEYTLNQSLDQITASVSPDQFFRVNRQYLINFKAIKEVELYFMRKLHVKLVLETPEKLLVNKEKSPYFLSWMENR